MTEKGIDYNYRKPKVAATQFSCVADMEVNTNEAIKLVREAAASGANIILLQELFKGLYFCQEQDPKYFSWAEEEYQSIFLQQFSVLAKELHIVLPISFFERKNNAYYNAIVVYDVDGTCVGKYRKTHIPDGPGYQEKYYFTPGDTGFQVFPTAFGMIGIGICWDQWFPETARSLALLGAEIIFYPTAIGSEPPNPSYDSSRQWERVMVGHAAANMIPVIASNRIGTETFDQSFITFYGSSFITDHTGEILQKANRTDRGFIIAELDLEKFRMERQSWGLFRDRRPNMYQTLLTKDGTTK